MTTQFVPCPNSGRCGSQTHQVGSAAFQECMAASTKVATAAHSGVNLGVAAPPTTNNYSFIERTGPGNIVHIRGVNGFVDDEDEEVEGLEPEDILDNLTESPHVFEVTQREDGSVWASSFHSDDFDPSSRIVIETNYEVARDELTIQGYGQTTEDRGNRLMVPVVDDKGRVTPEAVRMNSLVNTLKEFVVLDDERYSNNMWETEKETVQDAIFEMDDVDADYGLDLDDPEVVEEIAMHLSSGGMIEDGGTYVSDDNLMNAIRSVASRRQNI